MPGLLLVGNLLYFRSQNGLDPEKTAIYCPPRLKADGAEE
jgi:hypothetical protein